MGTMFDPRALVAEALGVFALVFASAGVLVIATGTVYVNLVAIALAPGLAILVMMAALGHVSRVHFNPAITIGLWVTRRIESPAAAAYVIAQLIGAIIAALALVLLLPESLRTPVSLGTPGLGAQIDFIQGVALEAIITFFLMLVFFGTVIDRRGPRIGAVAVGLAFALGVMVAEPFTGGAMNPARALGPALLSGTWDDHLVYWIGPIIGAVVASLLYHYAFADDRQEVEAAS
jgi:aquaporin TIP